MKFIILNSFDAGGNIIIEGIVKILE